MTRSERTSISSRVPDRLIMSPSFSIYDTELQFTYPCFTLANKIEIILEAGDVLYLPSYWWHRVHSVERSIGINWWYATHNVLLEQMMKTVDLNVQVDHIDEIRRPQNRW
jgi:ribosomal protein L16 Arg81 hydroxylase